MKTQRSVKRTLRGVVVPRVDRGQLAVSAGGGAGGGERKCEKCCFPALDAAAETWEGIAVHVLRLGALHELIVENVTDNREEADHLERNNDAKWREVCVLRHDTTTTMKATR
jgi:hypothetical protein